MRRYRVWAYSNHFFDMHLSHLGLLKTVFSLPKSPQNVSLGMAPMPTACWWSSCFHPEFPQGSPSGWLSCDGCSSLCLVIWQAIFFIHNMMPRIQHYLKLTLLLKGIDLNPGFKIQVLSSMFFSK